MNVPLVKLDPQIIPLLPWFVAFKIGLFKAKASPKKRPNWPARKKLSKPFVASESAKLKRFPKKAIRAPIVTWMIGWNWKAKIQFLF